MGIAHIGYLSRLSQFDYGLPGVDEGRFRVEFDLTRGLVGRVETLAGHERDGPVNDWGVARQQKG